MKRAHIQIAAILCMVTGFITGGSGHGWAQDMLDLDIDGETTCSLDFVFIEGLDLWVECSEMSIAEIEAIGFPADDREYLKTFPYFTMNWPAVNIEPRRIDKLCARLNKKWAPHLPEGCTFRLPSPAEWLIAANAGKDAQYPWGNNEFPPTQMADGKLPNYAGEECCDSPGNRETGMTCIPGYRDGYVRWAPVRECGMNDFQLFGMAGNVDEWCRDGEQYVRMGGSYVTSHPETMKTFTILRVKPRPYPFFPLLRDKFSSYTCGFRLVIAKKS